ncbi:MAG: AraC family transcriptional regulator [Prevotella sp.]|nr:AraC family transcriptional regulator [Prevotella sp.]
MSEHPITAEASKIAERGLMVFDNIHDLPQKGEAFTTAFMTVALTIEGKVKATCDMKDAIFHRHDVAVITPNHILCMREFSSDYHAFLIVISPAYYQELKRRFPNLFRDISHYQYRQDLPLKSYQFERVHNLFKVIRDISNDLNATHRLFMLGNMIETLFLCLKDFRKENGIAEHVPSMNEELFNRFHQDIVEHYHENREVKFYAERQHLSPKYFATVIKKQTGMYAHEWINNYTIIQAKRLLLHERHLSVQQVARRIGFTDQAVFSRFFRHITGITPSQYRSKG